MQQVKRLSVMRRFKKQPQDRFQKAEKTENDNNNVFDS